MSPVRPGPGRRRRRSRPRRPGRPRPGGRCSMARMMAPAIRRFRVPDGSPSVRSAITAARRPRLWSLSLQPPGPEDRRLVRAGRGTSGHGRCRARTAASEFSMARSTDVSRASVGRAVGQGVEERAHAGLSQGHDQVLFGGEVAEERPGRDVHGGHDVVDGGGVVAAFIEELGRCLGQLLAGSSPSSGQRARGAGRRRGARCPLLGSLKRWVMGGRWTGP